MRRSEPSLKPDGTPARGSPCRRISAATSTASPNSSTLAGLLSLVVGGVGVANAAQGFVERKRATLAILKAIGATGSGVVTLALVEFPIVALIGALAGAALGSAIPLRRQLAVRRLAADPARALDRARHHRTRADLRSADGASLSRFRSLGRAHDLPVTTLIRDMVEERPGWPRRRYLGLAALAGAALVALAVLDKPSAVDRGDGRGRDDRGVSRAAACRALASLTSRAARPGRASSSSAWRSPPSIGPAR